MRPSITSFAPFQPRARRSGRELTHYKRSTLLRRIGRRMRFQHVPEPTAYLELLRRQPEEIDALADDLRCSSRWSASLVFNVKKHAETERVTVRLDDEDGGLVVHVVDEGRGFEPEELRLQVGGGGLGLASIEERLRRLGGRVEIRSRRGTGTHVAVHAPVAAGRD